MIKYVCESCGSEKPISSFYKNNTKLGHTKKCKTCLIEIATIRYEDNREDVLAKNKTYQAKNKDKINKYKRDKFSNLSIKDKTIARQKNKDNYNKWIDGFSEEKKTEFSLTVKKRNREYWEENKQEIRAKAKIKYDNLSREDKDIRNEKARKRYNAEDSTVKQYHIAYREENKEVINVKSKQWRKENPNYYKNYKRR